MTAAIFDTAQPYRGIPVYRLCPTDLCALSVTPAQSIVGGAGLLLFFLVLLNGIIISKTKSARLSLSAHLTVVQSGTFLVAVAWMWPLFGMETSLSSLVAYSLSGSLFALWIAFCLAGLWGAGRGLMIAGQEMETSAVRQAIVTTLLGLGVLGTIAASAVLLFYWLEF